MYIPAVYIYEAHIYAGREPYIYYVGVLGEWVYYVGRVGSEVPTHRRNHAGILLTRTLNQLCGYSDPGLSL